MKTTFEQWMKKLNEICWKKFFCSVDDLEDYCWRDMYEDGYTPTQALKEATSGEY